MTPSLLVACLVLGEFDAARQATIEREQAKESAAVSAKYGNKKSSELSRDERTQMIREQAEAEKKVLDKYGVSQKEWIRQQAGRSRDQAQQVKDAAKALEETEKAAKATASDPNAPQEVTVQKGFSDEKPVVLEEKPGTTTVEQGLPDDYVNDQNAAQEADSFEKGVEKALQAPPAKGSGKKR